MTMGFGKPDPKAFPDVKAGDTVQFEFKEGGSMGYELTAVRRTGGAK
jgi:membrane fusion protein, copper/silver efflux system